jgi:hypothetical protein
MILRNFNDLVFRVRNYFGKVGRVYFVGASRILLSYRRKGNILKMTMMILTSEFYFIGFNSIKKDLKVLKGLYNLYWRL